MARIFRNIDRIINLKIVLVALLLILASVPVLNLARYYLKVSLASKQELIQAKDTGIILLDKSGKPFFTFGEINRKKIVGLNEISPYVQEALLTSEDKEFYDHPGFSLRGIARSALLDIKHRELLYGGSTITQQLVKNTLLNNNKSIRRKVEEIIIAWKLERKFSKQDIMEMYLNTVYFGENSYGIEQAANTFFGKSAKQLDLTESSFLIALLKSPSALSPLSNERETVFARQEQILQQMADRKVITEAQRKEATNKKFALQLHPSPLNKVAPHFALMVKDELEKSLGPKKIKNSLWYVQTTLDSGLQEQTERQLKEHVGKLRWQKVSNGAVVVLDARTGEVRALAGSADWHDPSNGKINMAIRPRQSGSAFKPIVYAAAFSDRVITPSTIIDDKRTIFTGGYEPKNYDRRYHGRVTARTALANSLNIPAVNVVNMLGPARIVEMAKLFGVSELSEYAAYNLSIALGTEQISLVDITNVYATMANGGVYHEPKIITGIRSKTGENKVISSKTYQAIDPRVAFMVSSILSDNKARARTFGTSLNVDRPAAVKTGTTQDYRDAWTVGYTPSLAVGVWIGNNDNSPMTKTPGALGAAPLWKLVMKNAYAGTPVEQFQQPYGVVAEKVCYGSGLLARSSNSGYEEYFLPGTEPTNYCAAPSPSPSPEPEQVQSEPEKEKKKDSPLAAKKQDRETNN